MPAFSFIAPNQCNEQHGRGNAGPFCNIDPLDDGGQAGLNPALILQGDLTVERLVSAIKSSAAWREGNNAIVVLWDENDYRLKPNTNQVMLIVDTNYGAHGVMTPIDVHPLLAAQISRGGFWTPLPQSCLRCER